MDFETVIVFSLRDLNFDNIDHMLTEQEIKLRYRELAMKFHPDRQIFNDDSWFKKINTAKDFLIDNLDQVNQFICKTNPQILREEAIRKEKAEEEQKRKEEAARKKEEQRKAKEEEERRKKEAEDRRKYYEELEAQRKRREAEEKKRKAEELRKQKEEKIKFEKWYNSLSPKEKRKYDKAQAKKIKNEKKRLFLISHPHHNRNKAILITSICTLIIGSSFLVWRYSIYPVSYYKNGMSLYEKQEYSLAIKQFEKAGNYKDSQTYLKRAQGEVLISEGKKHEAGFLFGSINTEEDYNRSKELLWNDYVISQTMAMSDDYMVALKSDGSLIGMQLNDKEHDYKEFLSWENVCYLAMTEDTIVGLCSDGSVLAEGSSSIKRKVKGWKNVVQIYTVGDIVFALKADGTIVHTSSRNHAVLNGIKKWKNIVNFDIAEGVYYPYDSDGAVYYYYAAGVKVDGSVQYLDDDNSYTETISTWSDIKMVSLSYGEWIGTHIVGLKSDNTVVACGTNHNGVCNVDSWKDVIQVHTLPTYTFGLKKDGTIILTGSDAFSRKDVSNIYHATYMPKINNLLVVDKNGNLQCEKNKTLAMSEWSNIFIPHNPF